MTPQQRKQRRRIWLKLIARWQEEKIDRSAWKSGTLEDEEDSLYWASQPVAARVENLMRLRWMNYGPDALYGRLEHVFGFRQLEPAPVSRRRRHRPGASRPRSLHSGH